MIVPTFPTAKPVCEFTNLTELREFPCGNGFCQNHADWEDAKFETAKIKQTKNNLIKFFIFPVILITNCINKNLSNAAQSGNKIPLFKIFIYILNGIFK